MRAPNLLRQTVNNFQVGLRGHRGRVQNASTAGAMEHKNERHWGTEDISANKSADAERGPISDGFGAHL